MSKNSFVIFMCIGSLLCGSVVMTFMPDPLGIPSTTPIYAMSNKYQLITDELNITQSSIAQGAFTRQRLIVIDPGHAGPVTHNKESVGTQSKYDINPDTGRFWTEYELTLIISKLIEQKLISKGYKVMMTRTENTKKGDNPSKVVSLDDRWKMAVNNNADAFIAIHFDGLDNSSYKGFHVIYGKDSDKNYAEIIRDSYKEKVSISVNSASSIKDGLSFRPNDLRVLNPDHQTRPAVLVELGTMTNKTDSSYICNKSNWEAMADGLVEGLDKYLGGSSEVTQDSTSAHITSNGQDPWSTDWRVNFPTEYSRNAVSVSSKKEYNTLVGEKSIKGRIIEWCKQNNIKDDEHGYGYVDYQGVRYYIGAISGKASVQDADRNTIVSKGTAQKATIAAMGYLYMVHNEDGSTWGFIPLDSKECNSNYCIEHWGQRLEGQPSILELYSTASTKVRNPKDVEGSMLYGKKMAYMTRGPKITD